MSEEHISVECGRCHVTVSALVIGDVHESDYDGDIHRVLLLRCSACGAAIVAHQFVESIGPDWEPHAASLVWPDAPKVLSTDAPRSVRYDFDDAHRCLRAGLATPAALMARRVLEGIAVNLGASGRGLQDKLKNLKSVGAIDDRLFEWAKALTIVGNSAAHEVAIRVSTEDATDALAFAEALADYVYTYRRRYEAFLERQKAKAAAKEVGLS